MIILMFIGSLFFSWLSVCFRLTLRHPLLFLYYLPVDIYRYIRYKKWRNYKTGILVLYIAYFGGGKTLSVVEYVVRIYNKYNGLTVYDEHRKKWVTQYINIISNVDLKIPCKPFISMRQSVEIAENIKAIDEENDTLTCTLFLGDEFGVQFNSRRFKENFNPEVLNALLTCRHNHISMFYDAQEFTDIDALMRRVTLRVISCKKTWRYMVQEYFNPKQLEYASDPTLVKPYKRTGFFIRDEHYEAYDTLACVDNLIKDWKNGDMMSEEEILALCCGPTVGIDNVTSPSRKLKRMRKGRR